MDGTMPSRQARVQEADSRNQSPKDVVMGMAKEEAAKAKARVARLRPLPIKVWDKRAWHLYLHRLCHRRPGLRTHGCSLRPRIMPLEDQHKRHP